MLNDVRFLEMVSLQFERGIQLSLFYEITEA